MKSFWKWFIGVVTTIVAALFFFKKRTPKTKEEPPSNDEVTQVFVEEINKDLNEGLSKVDKATKSSDASDELAKLGNTRSRR